MARPDPAGPPPYPGRARSVDELVGCLRELRAWAGLSEREVHRRVRQARERRGVPEIPAFNTVHRCFQLGRTRLDAGLVIDIVRVMLDDDEQVALWRHAHQVVAGEAARAAVVTVTGRLPERLPEFTGRGTELARILRLVTDSGSGRDGGDGETAPVIALEGMAGVGKTALAVEAAHQLTTAGRFEDTVLAVNLRGHDPELPPADPAAVLDELLRRLGIRPERLHGMTLASRQAEYRRRTAGRRMLLLLDDADDHSQVAPLLPRQPGTLTLITSRRRLSGLPGLHNVPVRVFSERNSLELFRKTAGARRIDADVAAATRIADLVGHLPLAVHLVAERIAARSDWHLGDHLERLEYRQDRLHLEGGVELALDASYTDLDAGSQRLFRLLTVHPGRSIDVHAAAALDDSDLAAARRRLDVLTERHLIQRDSADQYTFHDLVRIYARNQAFDHEPASSRSAALDRLRVYYVHAGAAAASACVPSALPFRRSAPADVRVPSFGDRAAAITWLDTERANLVSLAVHASETGRADCSGELSLVLYRYFDFAAHYRDGHALHASARMAPDLSVRSHALTNLGNACARLGRLDEAADHIEKALALARETGDRPAEGRALDSLGLVFDKLGDDAASLDHHRQAAVIAHEVGDRVGEAVTLGNVGATYERTGQFHDALECLERARDIAAEIASPTFEGRILGSIGTVHLRLGQLSTALGLHERSLAIAEATGDRQCQAEAHNLIGRIQRLLGRADTALRHHHAALSLAEETADLYEQARSHDGIGHCHADKDADDVAQVHWKRAYSLLAELGNPAAEDVAARLR